MSSSLDDMPSYEHFQQEMDDALALYVKKHPESSAALINAFIEFVCFHLFVDKWSQIDKSVTDHFHSWLEQRYPELEFNPDSIQQYLQENNK